MKKKEARSASPPVVPVEAAPTLRIPCYSIIFFWTQGSFCKILACNFMRYCISLSYCCYTCDLNILVTRIEASISSFRNWGVTIALTRICQWPMAACIGHRLVSRPVGVNLKIGLLKVWIGMPRPPRFPIPPRFTYALVEATVP
jgi:hypothetical protein